ncbi:MAG: hypothetical protein ACYC6Y_20010, partial [Thermoguttaceae bacterium]
MLRAFVGLLTLGLLMTLLAGTANSAPGARGARAASGRAGNVAGRVPGAPRQNALSTQPLSASGPLSAGAPLRNVNTVPAGPVRNTGNPVPSGAPLQSQLQSHLSNSQGTIQQKLGNAATAYGLGTGGPAPFSPAWYAQHPKAWQATHPYAGEAAVAVTAVSLASFMAIQSTVVSGGTTVVETSQPTPDQLQAAADLAQAGAATVDPAGEWMAVGVFALRPMDATTATRTIQLNVNRQGVLRGTHYDLLTEETADIAGAVDRNTTRVSWRIGENGR